MKRIILMSAAIIIASFASSQNVAITDDSLYTPHASSVLDIKSVNKGLLIPRVSLTSSTSESPVTTPATGLVVYNSATVSDVVPGFYFWNGAKWIKVQDSDKTSSMIIKDANYTIKKTETCIMASNDITLTLPEITATDNGLEITIKNIGTCVDLITVIGSNSTLIDATTESKLTRWQSKTFVAFNGLWQIKDFQRSSENIYEVGQKSSWQTIPEVLLFLKQHITGPALIRLNGETYELTEAQDIDLPYAVTFEGLSYGHTTIVAAAGLTNQAMFRCISESYFKKMIFDGTTLSSYGTLPGEDCIRLLGTNTYHEIKDCTFEGFYNTIVDSSNAELWLFECDIANANGNGVILSSNIDGVKLRISETDFISCRRGINLDKGTNAIIQLSNGSFLNDFATDTSFKYNPAEFSFTTLLVTNNLFNQVGKSMVGFDFTRADGRDANAFIENNAGIESKKPHCKINVLASIATTTVTTAGTWVKANFTNTNSYACKFAVSGNRLTYLSQQSYDGIMYISGNVICSNDSKIFSVAIIKNGNTAVKYGQTSVKIVNSSNPYQWSTNIYVEDMSQNDYYEIWITSSSSNDIFTLQDVQWFTNAQ